MFNVIFQVRPHSDKYDKYLELAQDLKPRLSATDGFINIERFTSLTRPGWVLSLSSWRDEKSIVRWRTDSEHHRAQTQGRANIFDDYTLHIGEVVKDSLVGADELPNQQRFDETEVSLVKAMGVTELQCVAPSAQTSIHAALAALNSDGLVGRVELYESIYSAGKFCALSSWSSVVASKRWTVGPSPEVEWVRHRSARIIRTYGMTDRREAPQFFGPSPVAHSITP